MNHRENDHQRIRETVTRRGLLRAGVLAPLGLGLADWLRIRALASTPQQGGRATACILIWLGGGASHIDTFDPKPDSPSEVRGEFSAIATATPGVSISEVLPNLARRTPQLAIIRSLTSPESDHDRAAHHVLTGYRPSPALIYPSLGSAVTKLGDSSYLGTLPPHVAIPQPPAFASSGFLTPAYDPFAVDGDPNSPGFRVRNLTPPDRLTLNRLERRRGMITEIDAFTHNAPPTPLTQSRDRFADRAFELLTSDQAARAFSLSAETVSLRESYGRTTLGQSCLLARRLVERGVPFVTVNDIGAGPLGWDTHQQNFATLRDRLAPPLDQAISALLDDLDSRGILDTTLVAVMGEFGRTPRINANAGRDHHGRASSVLLAGGGLRSGVVIGATDPRADAPIDRPVTPGALAATLYTALGIDPTTRLLTTDNQPIRLVDVDPPITELF